MVVSQKIIVNIIATVFLFLRKNIDMKCPKIAPKNDITMIVIEFLGVLLKISIPISNIFCPIAVDIARNAPIGIRSRMYFFVMPRMLGSECLQVAINDFFSKCLS